VAAGGGGEERFPGDKDTMGLVDRDGRLGEMVEHVDGHGGVEDVGHKRQDGGVGVDHGRRMGAQHGG